MLNPGFGGQSRWHEEFREWQAEALGDRRQVYARRAGAPPNEPLVFMPDGQADQFREDAKSGALICPVKECPSEGLTTVSSSERRDHFRHVGLPDEVKELSGSHREKYIQLATKSLLREWVRDQKRVVDMHTASMEGVPLMLIATLDEGSTVAVCYVDKQLGADAWAERHDFLLRAEGMAPAWVFGLRKSYFDPPKSPDPIDEERADLILDKAIYRRMRKKGSWPVLLSLQQAKFANVILPGGSRAENLHLPPTGLDRVVHVVPSRIADCRLCPYGIATPAVSEWILEKSSSSRRR